MDLKGRFFGILKKRVFNIKSLGTLLFTAWLIQYFNLDSIIANLFNVSPENIFFEVLITGTIYQFLKSIVEYIFDNGFG